MDELSPSYISDKGMLGTNLPVVASKQHEGITVSANMGYQATGMLAPQDTGSPMYLCPHNWGI